MHIGAWFGTNDAPVATTGTNQRQRGVPGVRYRFCRLAPNRRYLHYVETSEKKYVRPGVDDLPEKSANLPSWVEVSES